MFFYSFFPLLQHFYYANFILSWICLKDFLKHIKYKSLKKIYFKIHIEKLLLFRILSISIISSQHQLAGSKL